MLEVFCGFNLDSMRIRQWQRLEATDEIDGPMDTLELRDSGSEPVQVVVAVRRAP